MSDLEGRLLIGDCRERLRDLPDASIDAVITDPPYELGFMGKTWDAAGVAYDVGLWAEVLRVLKPGGHLLAFGGTRTYHRMACAIEDAGFEVRDSIHWLYGSGFPKSLDVSKAIDKAAEAEREAVGPTRPGAQSARTNAYGAWGEGITPTVPATDDARQWEGWGTALKPAHEPIVVARKPLVGTVAGNVLEHGTGALNIDGCRVGSEVVQINTYQQRGPFGDSQVGNEYASKSTAGRWPANLVLTHAADCVQVTQGSSTSTPPEEVAGGIWSPSEGKPAGPTYSDMPAVWRCAEGCPVAELDGQSGVSKDGVAVRRNLPPEGKPQNSPTSWSKPARQDTDMGYGGQGGASRFFTITEWEDLDDLAPFIYIPKPSRAQRNAGLDALPERVTNEQSPPGSSGSLSPRAGANRNRAASNHHPTVKPVALMRWLVRLVTPPGGIVLDPFLGSGTTAMAALLEGFDWRGIEMTDDYLPIIEGRIKRAGQVARINAMRSAVQHPPAARSD